MNKNQNNSTKNTIERVCRLDSIDTTIHEFISPVFVIVSHDICRVKCGWRRTVIIITFDQDVLQGAEPVSEQRPHFSSSQPARKCER